MLQQLGTGSILAVPLTRSTGTWGAMTPARSRPDGFSQDDRGVAVDLSRRAGRALDNARTHTRQASVAETLQRALLPDLPAIEGITAAAHYAAASVLTRVDHLTQALDLPSSPPQHSCAPPPPQHDEDIAVLAVPLGDQNA